MKTYTVNAKAYGKEPGDTIQLDPDDAGVRLNLAAGVLTEGKQVAAVESAQMTCPICNENMKRPPRFDSAEDLQAHYQDKHAGFVTPEWRPDTDG